MKFNTRIGVRLSQDILKRLDELAERLNVSKSEVCRRLMIHALNNGFLETLDTGGKNEG